LTLADGAAEAGALALAEGGSATEAARQALPGWADDNVAVAVEGEEVSVRLRLDRRPPGGHQQRQREVGRMSARFEAATKMPEVFGPEAIGPRVREGQNGTGEGA